MSLPLPPFALASAGRFLVVWAATVALAGGVRAGGGGGRRIHRAVGRWAGERHPVHAHGEGRGPVALAEDRPGVRRLHARGLRAEDGDGGADEGGKDGAGEVEGIE